MATKTAVKVKDTVKETVEGKVISRSHKLLSSSVIYKIYYISIYTICLLMNQLNTHVLKDNGLIFECRTFLLILTRSMKNL